ncbi:recombinase family protein [Vibrio splendidus]|uniref:recombinase family protein n=1 Tax=Vibrio splendidus TaxID=29497 RepID=UPI00076A5EDF|nr:recombinase family protein [Vibrio splendidus]PHX06563.1 hypothetical protein VSPL_18530 [Vibrio splendidus]
MKINEIKLSVSNVIPVVITYTRFSTNIQKEGLSEYRQDELTQRYVIDFCEAHGIPLNDIISLKDRGVSAYRGKNMTQGSLSELIKLFKSGDLPKVYNEKGEINTFFFIESLDRLTRSDLHTANKLFLDLVEYCNIVVVAENEQKVYSLNSLKSDMGMLDLFSALLTLSRSHNESRMKEMRHRENWSKKRQEVMDYFDAPKDKRQGLQYPLNPTKTCPWWLKPKSDDRGFEFIEENRKAMKFFLDRMLEGYGLTSSIRRLNDAITNGEFNVEFTKRQAVKKGFQTHTFYQTLTDDSNESLIGNLIFHKDYYPTEKDVQQGLYERKKLGKKVRIPVYTAKGFYPALLSDIELLMLRKMMGARKQSNTKPNKRIANIAQGILKCPKCGFSYVVNDDKRPGRHSNLVCSYSRSGKCNAYTYRVEYFEYNLLRYCRNINIGRVLGNQVDDSAVIKEVTKLQHKQYQLNLLKAQLQVDIDQLVSNISNITIPSLLEKVQHDYSKKEMQIQQYESQVKSIESDILAINMRHKRGSNTNDSIYELIDIVSEKKDVEKREKLNIEFKKIIKSMSLINKKDADNPFGLSFIRVVFIDGYSRFIPVDRKLVDSELFDFLPTLETEKLVGSIDYKKTVILPTDYLDGLESGKYPQLDGMAQYYQENPAKYLKLKHQIDQSQEIYE